jgi:hypothetical protein
MKKLITGMAFLLLTTFVACRKQAADTAINNFDPQLYKTLLSAGIPESQIIEQEEYYVVWGQLRFKKGKTSLEQVKAWFAKAGKPVAQEEQTRHLLLMNSEVVQSIRVYANVPYDWDYVTRKAMQDWAAIPNCKINFYYVTFTEAAGLGDVQVLPDGGMLNEGVPVLTEFPSGSSGWKIWVNTDVYTTAPGNQVPVADRPSAMRYDMAHAFGYTLGFLPPGEPGGIQIPGTPAADAASVMNPNGFHLWNGFSAYDIVAAQYLYPYTSLDKWITSVQDDFNADNLTPGVSYAGFDITWDASLVNSPTITLELYQHRTYIGTIASTIPNSGHFAFTESHFNAFFPAAKQSGVQIRIINDTKEWETDFSAMFFINWE